MDTTLKPETAARIARLSIRLGCTGPDACEQVLKLALDDLEAKAPPPRRKLTPEEIAAEYRLLSAAGRRYRQEHPHEYADPANPPSKVWQDELYDANGLPV